MEDEKIITDAASVIDTAMQRWDDSKSILQDAGMSSTVIKAICGLSAAPFVLATQARIWEQFGTFQVTYDYDSASWAVEYKGNEYKPEEA